MHDKDHTNNKHPDWWFADEETFMRNMTLCEEERVTDRLSPYKGPWQGGFRWFRSPNVVCFEKYQRAARERQDAA
jgi:hypothetical protein